MSSKNYEEFKATWGRLSLPELRGLNASNQFARHQDWFVRLVGELEAARADANHADLVAVGEGQTQSMKANTRARKIGNIIALVSLIGIPVGIVGAWSTWPLVWDWIYNQFH